MKKYNLFRNIAVFVQKHRRSKTVRGIFISLASLTVFTTTYALILPAITLERKNAEQMPGIELIDGAVIEDGIDEFDNLSNELLYGSSAYGSDQDPTSLSADEDS